MSRFILCFLVFVSCFSNAQQSVQTLFNQYRHALYQIQIIDMQSGNKSSIGSGFQINKQGDILSNYHVIADYIYYPDRYKIQYLDSAGNSGFLALTNFDVINDLSLLKKSNTSGLTKDANETLVDARTHTDITETPTLETADYVSKEQLKDNSLHDDNTIDSSNEIYFKLANSLPAQGSNIYSLGNPHDLGMIVVPGTYNGLKKNSFYKRIHFTGSINPGMSGGPAVNLVGEVVGVNVATAGNQIGFLIPLPKIKSLLQQNVLVTQENYKSEIARQLHDNQAKMLEQLTLANWTYGPLGKASVPERFSDFISCWGGSNINDKNATYFAVANRCRVGEAIYLNSSSQTGEIELEFEWVSSEKLNAVRFYNLMTQKIAFTRPGNKAGKNDVTNYQCQQGLTKNQHGMISKTILCARTYKDFPNLYDALFISASNDFKQGSLISHFTLSGVSKKSINQFTGIFMEATSWL